MADLYPMFFKPVLKSTIWGGRRLERFGRKLPEKGIVAESWEISGHEDGMTPVINGIYEGKSLKELTGLLGTDLVGANNKWAVDRGKFPLLVKLIDANQKLSVQVHPDDTYALEHEGNELGKTEMWVVLDAEPDAAIIYGLSEPVDADQFSEAISSGNLEPYLNKVSIKAGDHVCVPSGTLHAILDGSVIAEIQQNSNTTYRVYDWGRLGVGGKPRQLHVSQALDVINFEQVGLDLPKLVKLEEKPGYCSELLCANEYFTTERYHLRAGQNLLGNCDGSTLEIWGVLSGRIELDQNLMNGIAFVLLPASLGLFEIKAVEDAVLLRAYTK